MFNNHLLCTFITNLEAQESNFKLYTAANFFVPIITTNEKMKRYCLFDINDIND